MIEKLIGSDTVCLGVLNSKHKVGMKKFLEFVLHIKHYANLKFKKTPTPRFTARHWQDFFLPLGACGSSN